MAIIMPTNNPNSSNQTGQPTNGERRQVSSKACVLSIIKDALALLDDDDWRRFFYSMSLLASAVKFHNVGMLANAAEQKVRETPSSEHKHIAAESKTWKNREDGEPFPNV